MRFSVEKKKIADAHIHTHTLSRTHPKPPPESLWSAREKMSINTSVGLPWLEHVTVSLFSGCVNLFCRVCCESVYSLKQRSMPAGFFFLLPGDFAVHNRFDVSRLCQCRGLGPTQRWNIESYASQTTGPGYFLWRGTVRWDWSPLLSPLWESFCAASGSMWADWCRPFLCFHLNPLFSLCSFELFPAGCLSNFLSFSASLRWLEYFCLITWILSGFEAVVNQRFIVSATSVNFVGESDHSEVHL